jgi:hypothetical protein
MQQDNNMPNELKPVVNLPTHSPGSKKPRGEHDMGSIHNSLNYNPITNPIPMNNQNPYIDKGRIDIVYNPNSVAQSPMK